MKQRKGSYFEIWLSSYTGRRFLNMAYSWGAAVVILGAMFKILHISYGNILLMVGMIVEAMVFLISGFDNSSDDSYDSASGETEGKTVTLVKESPQSNIFTPEYSEKMAVAAQNMGDFSKIMTSINEVSLSLLASYKQIADSTEVVLQDNSSFAGNIKNLNTNVSGLNEIYESQLQSIEDQISTIKYINESLDRIKNLYDGTISDSTVFREETEKMTRQIEALNKVYARLLQAMTANNNPSSI